MLYSECVIYLPNAIGVWVPEEEVTVGSSGPIPIYLYCTYFPFLVGTMDLSRPERHGR